MEGKTEFHSMEELPEGPLDSAPSGCGGNACSDIGWDTRRFPGQNILATVKLTNTGSKAVNVSIDWGNVLGGCGVGTSAIIQPGASHTARFTPEQMILGYCSYWATKEEDGQ